MLSVYHKSLKTIFIILIIIIIPLTACGDSTQNEDASAAAPPSIIASCDATTMMGFCYDYVGPGWDQEKVELDCSIFDDSLLEYEPCSQESVTASCNFDLQGNAELAITYYYYQPMDLDTAEMMCPGTFIPNN